MDFQVRGNSGYTRPCLVALDEVLSGPLDVRRATVLTKRRNEHLFILWQSDADPHKGLIVPTGFASGYSGEGPRGFSLALCMLYEQGIPIDRLDVTSSAFDQVDSGDLPQTWVHRIKDLSVPCEMPVPGWVHAEHWELAQNRRLWRVQGWQGGSSPIEWTESTVMVDNFSWHVGDKLEQARGTLRPNARPEHCQSVGLILRDAWIQFSRELRTRVTEDTSQVGRNDAKGVVHTLRIPPAIKTKAKKAFNMTNALQHDLKAAPEDAIESFGSTTEAMALIVEARFPGEYVHRRYQPIRPN